MKKLLSLILVVAIAVSCVNLAGCGKDGYADPTKSLEIIPSQDKYRNYYEIFVGSFCDSNDDGIGDLQGIISKLDYLNDGNPETDTDLGIDGIWLTPIMPSHSYHKYDVIDYYEIDEDFGTLEDFKQLVDECHSRGINIIIDMVLNHCSKFMPMFVNACKEVKAGNFKGDAKYFELAYHDSNPGNTFTDIGDGYFYESNFSPYMPEWNLNAGCTRKYFLDVAEFWLNDYNVDGFRLDALKYYDDYDTDGQEFLKWYYEEVQKIKADVYMVGEYWTGNSEIIEMYNSNIDSQFAFGFAGSTGAFMNSVRSQRAGGAIPQIMTYQTNTEEANEDVINAYFLSNHDQVRSGNYLRLNGASYTKMAASAYMLIPGNPFIYYGEEIGVVQNTEKEGDEYKREPMVWDTENPPEIKVNGLTGYDESQAPYGGVEQQLKDENSILSHYRRIIKIKNQNPEIARGKITGECDFEDDNISAYYIEYENSELLIIQNYNAEEVKELTLTDEALKNPVIRGDLVASNGKQADGTVKNEHITLVGSTLKMPPQSTVILKSK